MQIEQQIRNTIIQGILTYDKNVFVVEDLDDKFGISISEQEVQSWATIQDVFDTLQLYESIYS